MSDRDATDQGATGRDATGQPAAGQAAAGRATDDSGNLREAPLDREVRRERTRRARGERSRGVSIGRYLATAGAIGWLVVTPTLLGAFFGRWLDARYQTGITFSGALLTVGLVTGCYLAWNVLRTEGRKQ